ncbi:hypothetical protein EMPS_07935 [Entomortierella parvispora]|uniref:Uncharacterized protein n=1 Tax=Entomortierella parvispora TaxID=205924 RepID=A0A9P3LYX3_9FUNG|nr:hypothetical protein EMPS_07935 [Entomortierella parvispora]
MSSITTVPPLTVPATTTPASTAPPLSTSTAAPLPSPTADPDPGTGTGPGTGPDPATTAKPTASKKPGKTTSVGGGSNPSGIASPSTLPGSDSDNNKGGDSSNKSILAPVIGGVAAVLVVAFFVAVFVMRYRKKSRARKRRLDFLGDHSTGTDHGRTNAASPALGALAAGGRRPDSDQSRPSAAGNRPLEMAAVGGAAGLAGGAALAHHNKNNNQDGYDYQQGYQQVPYGGQYSEQQYEQPNYDQYDPYYSQSHPQPAGYYGDAQQQQQQQQQQGYYNDQYTQNKFAPPAPVGYAGPGSSPSMTHATASPKSYPQPPPSTTTGGQSSPRTPQQVAAVPVPGRTSYDKNAKVENAYVGTHSAARNPQVMPQDEEKIKVPV